MQSLQQSNNKMPHDIFNKLPHGRIVITFGFEVDYQKIF